MELQFTEIKSMETERGVSEFVCVTVGGFVNITLNVASTKDGRKFCSLPSKKFGAVYDPIVYLLDRQAEKSMLDAATKWYHQQKATSSNGGAGGGFNSPVTIPAKQAGYGQVNIPF